ncbi:Hypothetical protein MVR_LOCUS310 [uncultured virus]|nr:Hypothetical protein MVR_LOCUS310 [uncultured virus]
MALTQQEYLSADLKLLLTGKTTLIMFIVEPTNTAITAASHAFANKHVSMESLSTPKSICDSMHTTDNNAIIKVEWNPIDDGLNDDGLNDDGLDQDGLLDLSVLGNIEFKRLVIINQTKCRDAVFIDLECFASTVFKFEQLYLKSISLDSLILNMMLNCQYFACVVLDDMRYINWNIIPLFYQVTCASIITGTEMACTYTIQAIAMRDFWKLEHIFDLFELSSEFAGNDNTSNNLIVALCHKTPLADILLDVYQELIDQSHDLMPVYRFMIYLLSLFEIAYDDGVSDVKSIAQQKYGTSQLNVTVKNKANAVIRTNIIQRCIAAGGSDAVLGGFVDKWCDCINDMLDDGIDKYVD